MVRKKNFEKSLFSDVYYNFEATILNYDIAKT